MSVMVEQIKQRHVRIPDKQMAKVAKVARKAGWSVELAKSGHLHWRSPEGRLVSSSLSPSDRFAVRNLMKDLRRAGLNVR